MLKDIGFRQSQSLLKGGIFGALTISLVRGDDADEGSRWIFPLEGTLSPRYRLRCLSALTHHSS